MFSNSHDFYINNLFASDGKEGSVTLTLLKDLANAACLGAGHQFAERGDPPKCHPETRAAVIGDIMSWVNSGDAKQPIMWMSGPAGAGKSTIAQTVCEICYMERQLLASFFFSRTATESGRNEGRRLVPIIACQMAIAIPESKGIIIKQLETDPAMLSYSMEKQLQMLVLEPLDNIKAKFETDNSSTAKASRSPYLVVIDGLDECNDRNVQSRIVKMISNIFATGDVPLRFLIASRPELEIRSSFEPIIDDGMCAQITLNEKYNPEEDIETYLTSEFVTLKREHTLKKSLLNETSWPSSLDILVLVQRSSGQFIYASTVMSYLKNPRRDPRQGLQVILDAEHRSRMNESPYASLDALYKHILSSATEGVHGSYNSFKTIFQLMLFAYRGWRLLGTSASLLRDLNKVSHFIGMKQSELELLLADLHSILYLPSSGSNEEIKFYHASFGDFLKILQGLESFIYRRIHRIKCSPSIVFPLSWSSSRTCNG